MNNAHKPSETVDRAGIASRLDRPLVLVGLMGVGKTSIGRRLAGALGRDFVDADEEIEKAADRSVSEIFEEHGEAYFRDGERRVIARLLEEGHGVIATGGGAFVDPETRALVLEKGVAVWLDCDLDTLVERTSRRNTRPLLKTGDPREILVNLKEQRGPAYAEAQIHVVTGDGPHDAAVNRILEELAAWL
ncbi:shikimate kinase [Erythrobacter gaetbuli]|uniref:Shikimate kinase n=1 Tax=Qipengyuania gaetbuli TaxID=266952 RepID=A0A844XZP5_9SPHN|nr:shikimate kinase [Qipengyuania gaetbuli]MXO50799.1 shikimate kinase [Qipengyuania gaetbuli]